MGYTHYFESVKVTPQIAAEAKKIVAASDVEICGGLGEGKPNIRNTEIYLNGSEAKGEDYETFALDNDTNDWSFTKTARMPYDEVVTAILISVMLNSVDATVSSNGRFDEWADGIALYERAVRKLSDIERDNIKSILG